MSATSGADTVMRAKTEPTIANRAISALAVACLVGLSLWTGLYVRRRPPAPLDLAGPGQDMPLVRAPALRITRGPEVLPAGEGHVVEWTTSVPADSLLTYGRQDALEHVLFKDATLVTEHRAQLPDVPLIELCRFRAMSVDADGNVAAGECGPAAGPGAALHDGDSDTGHARRVAERAFSQGHGE